jgi:hypothetical protein
MRFSPAFTTLFLVSALAAALSAIDSWVNAKPGAPLQSPRLVRPQEARIAWLARHASVVRSLSDKVNYGEQT